MNKPRVFVVSNADRFDLTPAEKYGEIKFLMRQPSSPFNPEGFMNILAEALSAEVYNPDVDFIAFTGHSLHISLLVGLVMSQFDSVKVLLFDSRSGEYKDRTINVDKLCTI